MNAERAEIELLQQAGQLLNERLMDELIKQGHHLTGALEQSIGYDMASGIVTSANRTRIIGSMAQYGVYVNFGVKSSRIPYSGVRTGATTSKYIQGLKTFWMLKGLSEKDALNAAFATANKQKQEGMPTMGSYMFTETGQRLRFIPVVEEKYGSEIDEKISTGLDEIIDALFHETKSEII